jgi:hypothetical protein
MSRGKVIIYVLGTPMGLAYNVPRVCDEALRPTKPKGHVAEQRAEALGARRAPMHIIAVMHRCEMPFQIMLLDEHNF